MCVRLSKNILFFLFFLIPTRSISQAEYRWNESLSSNKVEGYGILPDKEYSLDEVLSERTPAFVTGDSLDPQKADFFWYKIIINNPKQLDAAVNLKLHPNLNNTIYFFDTDLQKWQEYQAGIFVAADKHRSPGNMPVILKGGTNIFYIRSGVADLHQFDFTIKPEIFLEKQSAGNSRAQVYWAGWIASILVLSLFFLNNVYVYFSFKDRSVLYYLIAQLGGMIYITSYGEVFNTVFPGWAFSIGLWPNGFINFYNMNYFLQHVSIVLIMFGFVQLTRHYLDTRKFLPRLNTMLKYGLNLYILISIVLSVINIFFFYFENNTLVLDNAYLMVLIGLILFTCVMAKKRKLRAAGSFLLANILPLVFMLVLTLLHIVAGFDNNYVVVMPYLAIVSQALGFSIALVARTRLIQHDLKVKEMEAQQLEFDISVIALQRERIEVENKKIMVEIQLEKTQNKLLQEQMDANQRELASTSLYIVQKNEMLATLKTEIRDLHKLHPDKERQQFKSIESILNSSEFLDADWAKFKLHFEQVHPDFFETLEEKYPSITKNEIRLYAYFHMKLSTKEIAALLNIEPASVRRAKTRLFKKMTISDQNTIKIVDSP